MMVTNSRTFWIWEYGKREIYCGEEFLKSIGQPSGQPAADYTFWSNVVHPDHLESFMMTVESYRNSHIRKPFIFSTTFTDQDKHPQNITLEGVFLTPDKANGVIRFPDEKNSCRLDDSYLLNMLMDHLQHSIFFKDKQSRFTRINKACAKKFGLNSPEEAVGKTDFDFFDDVHAQLAYDDEQKIIQTGTPIYEKIEKEVFSDDENSVRWASTTKLPLRDPKGSIIGTFGITKDITEQKKQTDNLRETLDIVSDQNNRFHNFAHIVTHNLRNHAGNISMILSLFETADSEKETEELIGYLHASSNRLNETISDLNQIVDAQNDMNIVMQSLNLKETIGKVKEILSTEIMGTNTEFEEQVPDDLMLQYNPAYLESILLNLISNAIKYRHPDRTPNIRILAEETDNDVVLNIADNGLGIDLDKYGEQIFGMYKTFHENKNSKGIGLYITKNQIESLGGSISVDSTPGEGTVFTIHFGR
jgi:PAS domain S-box-containing protein